MYQYIYKCIVCDSTDPTMRGLNIKTGIFGPADSRLSLPGAVGVSFGPNGQRKRGTGSLSLGKDEDIGTADGGVLEENKGDLLVRVLAPLPPHMSAVEVFNNVDSAYQAQLLVRCQQLNFCSFDNNIVPLFTYLRAKYMHLRIIHIC